MISTPSKDKEAKYQEQSTKNKVPRTKYQEQSTKNKDLPTVGALPRNLSLVLAVPGALLLNPVSDRLLQRVKPALEKMARVCDNNKLHIDVFNNLRHDLS